MTGKLVGRTVNAVLIPPQVVRFAALTGLDVDTLDVNVQGWNKFVLLAADRVFLFPRTATAVEWFERELLAYEALAPTGLEIVPRVLDRWVDDSVYQFPFASCARLPGRVPEEPEALIEQLGRAIARWHALEPPDLPGSRPPAHHDAANFQWLRRALDPLTTVDAATEAADRLGRPDLATSFSERLGAAARLTPVLVHGDIHEDQLLARDGELTGVIDWETVRIDHPFWDFDFGEWGTGIWRRQRGDFSALWARGWASYARERGVSTDSRPLETAFRLRHALHLLDNERDPALVGTIEEHLSHLSS